VDVEPRPRLVLVAGRPSRATDRVLQLADGEPRRALDPHRLLLAGGDGQDRLRRAQPHPAGAERVSEERPGPKPAPEPDEPQRGAPAQVEHLERVVVEVTRERGEPVALAERREPLRDRDVERAAGPRGPREEPLAVLDLGRARAEHRAQLAGREGGQLGPRRRERAQGGGGGGGIRRGDGRLALHRRSIARRSDNAGQWSVNRTA
jgi:hypothetical protein